jgi:uncharacterized membrane protein
VSYLVVKYLHVLGAIVVLGTGLGIAYFMLMAHRSGDAAFVARTAEVAVIADWIFTATAVAAQPLTGFELMRMTGISPMRGWIAVSLVLYGVAGAAWVPVVGIQIGLRDLAREAVRSGVPLPERYRELFRTWMLLGIPGFASVLAIVWLMVAKPTF